MDFQLWASDFFSQILSSLYPWCGCLEILENACPLPQQSSKMVGIYIAIFQLTNPSSGLTLRSMVFIFLEFSKVITNPYPLLSAPSSIFNPLVCFFTCTCLLDAKPASEWTQTQRATVLNTHRWPAYTSRKITWSLHRGVGVSVL